MGGCEGFFHDFFTFSVLLMNVFSLFILNLSQKHREGPFLCNFHQKAYSMIFFLKKIIAAVLQAGESSSAETG